MHPRSLLIAIAAAALAASPSLAQQDGGATAPASAPPPLPDFSVAPANHAGAPALPDITVARKHRKARARKAQPAAPAAKAASASPAAPATRAATAKPALATEGATAIPASARETSGAGAPAAFPQAGPAARVDLAKPATPEAAAPHSPGFGDEDSPFFAALRLGLLIPAGKPAGAVADAGVELPNAHRAGTVPVSLQLGYRLPWLSRRLAITAEAGWYPLSAHGGRSLPQDPDYGQLQYSWTATQVPLLLGLQYALPFELFGRLGFNVNAAATAIWSRYTTTYLAENVQDAPQKGWALGAAVGAGASLRLGPGALLFDLRYVDARTDLRLRSAYPTQPYNAQSGDVQGTNFLAGYRLDL